MKINKYICLFVVTWTLLTTNCHMTEAFATYSCTHNELEVEIQRWKMCSDVSIQTSIDGIFNIINRLDSTCPITLTRLSPFCYKYIPFFRDQIKCLKNLSQKCFQKNISDFFSDILLILKCEGGCNCTNKLSEITSLWTNLGVGLLDFMYLDGYVFMYPSLILDKGCDIGKMFEGMKKNSLKCDHETFHKYLQSHLMDGNPTTHFEICKYWKEVHSSCYNQGNCYTKREIDLWLRVTFSMLDFYFKVVNQLFQNICHRSYLQYQFYYPDIFKETLMRRNLRSIPLRSFCPLIDQLQNSFKSDYCNEISKNISKETINADLQRNLTVASISYKSVSCQEVSKNISEETVNDEPQRKWNVELFSSTAPQYHSLVLLISIFCVVISAIVAYKVVKSCHEEMKNAKNQQTVTRENIIMKNSEIRI